MYAQQSDIEKRYPGILAVIAVDDSGETDQDRVESALSDAAEEIDLYLQSRYDLPLDSPPKILTNLNVDIAIYKLAAEADAYTDERKDRYNNSVKLLDKISKGQIDLGISTDDTSDNISDVQIISKVRVFDRGTMRGVL